MNVYHQQKGFSLSFTNCTLTVNTANTRAALYNFNGRAIMMNSIVWNNSSTTGYAIVNNGPYQAVLSYNNIQGCNGSGVNWNTSLGIDGGYNIDGNPNFVNPPGADSSYGTADDDLSLSAGSPGLGTGIGGANLGINWPVEAVDLIAPVDVTNPVDLALDSQGYLYVLSNNPTQNTIKVYNDQLQLQRTIDITTNDPYNLSLDSDGSIYIADYGGDQILKYTNAGSLDTTFGNNGSVGQSGTGDGQFDGPRGIGIGLDGSIYVSDSGNNRVQIFDAAGQYIDQWGEYGSGDGQLNNPSDFCLLPTGVDSEVLLADSSNNRIQRLLTNTGYFLSKIGEQGIQSGQFDTPQNVCYDPQFDQIAIADTANNRIQLFQLNHYSVLSDNEMIYVNQISGLNLSGPMSTACASNDMQQILYIADTGNNRILKVKSPLDEPGNSPLHVIEGFKAALWSDDLYSTLPFFTDEADESYLSVLKQIKPKFQEMVDDMMDVVLISNNIYIANYDILREEDGQVYGYPIFLVRDENGIWKISGF